MTTFGIEEEFFLVDPPTLQPAGLADAVLHDLPPESAGRVTREFLVSQLERATAVFSDLAEAAADLAAFRAGAAAAARRRGTMLVGTGTSFDAPPAPTLTDAARYRTVGSEVRGMLRDHQICATQVHVGVPSREAGVHALNSVRVWLPTLMALTGNSPFWRGQDTGFASWRAVIMRRWATTGCPPVFADAADYDRRLARLVGVAGTVDTATVAWYARLSEKYPTLEVRVADAQLDLDSTLLLAALARALVVTGLLEAERGTPPPELEPELMDAALWHASRDGIRGRLVDPGTRDLAPAWVVTDKLLRHVGDALDEAGDRPRVVELLDRLWQDGTGAETQQRAFQAGGIPGLRGVYESAFA
ncbi:carboxylate-amine ligase [Cryobacterium sp. AP23]